MNSWCKYLFALLAALAPLAGNAKSLDWMTVLRSNDPAQLERALEQGLDVNERLADGSLPLAWAIELQDERAVQQLLEAGSRTEDLTIGANTFQPLIVACQHGNTTILMSLLEAGADVNVRGPEGIPALAICAGHSPVEVVKAMLVAGADIDAVDDNGQSPLMWAGMFKQVDIFNLLVSRGADVNLVTPGGFSPLFFAIKSGDPKIAQAAASAGANLGHTAPDGTTAFQLALYQGNYGFAEAMLENKSGNENETIEVDVHAYDRVGRQPLHVAVLNNQPRLVGALIAHGADVNALTSDSKVKWKYESNFRPGSFEFPHLPPIMLAIQQELPLLVKGLASAGAATDFQDENGNNMVLAAAWKSPETLKAALTLAPDPNVKNSKGQTALHLVLKGTIGPGMDQKLALLAAAGADPDIADDEGVTPAEVASDEAFRNRELFASLFVKSLGSYSTETSL